MSTLSQFVGGSPIKSIQRGTISLANSVDASKSATISSVDTSKTMVNFLGNDMSSNNGPQHYLIRLDLTSSTLVTATRNQDLGNIIVSYEVIEFN